MIVSLRASHVTGFTRARSSRSCRDSDVREAPVRDHLRVGHDVPFVGGGARETIDRDVLDRHHAVGDARVSALRLVVVRVNNDGVGDVLEHVVRVSGVVHKTFHADDGLDADAIDVVDNLVVLDDQA